MDLFWTPPNLHDDTERVELYICGPVETNELLFVALRGPAQGDWTYGINV